MGVVDAVERAEVVEEADGAMERLPSVVLGPTPWLFDVLCVVLGPTPWLFDFLHVVLGPTPWLFDFLFVVLGPTPWLFDFLLFAFFCLSINELAHVAVVVARAAAGAAPAVGFRSMPHPPSALEGGWAGARLNGWADG